MFCLFHNFHLNILLIDWLWLTFSCFVLLNNLSWLREFCLMRVTTFSHLIRRNSWRQLLLCVTKCPWLHGTFITFIGAATWTSSASGSDWVSVVVPAMSDSSSLPLAINISSSEIMNKINRITLITSFKWNNLNAVTVSQVLRDGMTGSDGQQHSDNPLNFMKYSGIYKHHTLYVIVVVIAIKRLFFNGDGIENWLYVPKKCLALPPPEAIEQPNTAVIQLPRLWREKYRVRKGCWKAFLVSQTKNKILVQYMYSSCTAILPTHGYNYVYNGGKIQSLYTPFIYITIITYCLLLSFSYNLHNKNNKFSKFRFRKYKFMIFFLHHSISN